MPGGKGATLSTLSLARLAARRGVSVVLVDGDYENPQVAQQLGMAFDRSWGEQAKDPATISEVAVQSIEDNLTVLPLCPAPPAGRSAPPEAAGRALASLAAQHDVLLIDAGPMFAAARHWFSRQAGQVVDCALVVRDVRTVTDEQLGDVVERLGSRDIPVVGVAENYSVTSAPVASQPPTS